MRAETAATAQSSTPTTAVANLPVTDTGTISYELRNIAPIAQTPPDRVQLWLEKYSGQINAAASLRHIDPVAIAGAIAWEALINTHFGLTGSYGPGKVHPTESDGLSAAAQVENLGYLPAYRTQPGP